MAEVGDYDGVENPENQNENPDVAVGESTPVILMVEMVANVRFAQLKDVLEERGLTKSRLKTVLVVKLTEAI